MVTLNKIFKRKQYQEQKEFEKRAEEFKSRYQELSKEFGCDFRAFLMPIEDGKAVIAKMQIINIKNIKKADKK